MDTMPRVAAIHDLSCFGRCSLTVIAPALSAMGVQCCPLPTAVLSSHTGGFGPVARTDLADQMVRTLDHWGTLGLTFHGVYTGYLASEGQIALAGQAAEALRQPGGLVVVDPVLGDHGKLYASFTRSMVAAMAQLCRRADVITPNLTEAALLLGETADGADGETLAARLSDGGRRSVVVTGVTPAPGLVGCAGFDRDSGTTFTAVGARVEEDYPGTGDLFAAVLTGGLVRGEPLERAARRATDFVRQCAARTLAAGRPSREGVEFEPLLGLLCRDTHEGGNVNAIHP
jgi:pyridoxine kinase